MFTSLQDKFGGRGGGIHKSIQFDEADLRLVDVTVSTLFSTAGLESENSTLLSN